LYREAKTELEEYAVRVNAAQEEECELRHELRAFDARVFENAEELQQEEQMYVALNQQYNGAVAEFTSARERLSEEHAASVAEVVASAKERDDLQGAVANLLALNKAISENMSDAHFFAYVHLSFVGRPGTLAHARCLKGMRVLECRMRL